MEYSKLNSNSKKSWFVARLITTIIAAIILYGGQWAINKYLKWQWVSDYSFYINVAIGIFMAFLILNTVLYPIIEYKQWKYIVTEDKVDFTEGIFTLKRTVIPILRIQHITVTQGPINKFFKLGDISIVTAGGSHEIPNIEIEKANDISEYLKSKVKEKVENDGEFR